MTADEDIGRFLAAVGATSGAWGSMQLRCVAVRNGGRWLNLITHIDLLSTDHADDPAIVPLAATLSCLAFQATMRVEDLRAVLESVRQGRLAVAGNVVDYTGLPQSSAQQYGSFHPTIGSPISDLRDSRTTPAIGHRLHAWGPPVLSALDTLPGGAAQVDHELRSMDAPWDGLRQLLQYGIGLQKDFTNETSHLIVTALLPVQVVLPQSRLSGGRLTVAVEARNPKLAAFTSLGYVGMREGVLAARGVVPRPEDTRWVVRDGVVTWTDDAQIGLTDSAAVFARVGPFVVDRRVILDDRLRAFSPLRDAYQTIDPDLELLRSWLLEAKSTEQVEFERAVGRVLVFAGFMVDSFSGHKRLSDAADLVAWDPTRELVLVVECTVGPLKSRDGKLSRLVHRTHSIRERIGERAGGVTDLQVVPLAVTRLEAKAVASADRSAAVDDGIIIWDREILRDLLVIIEQGGQPDDVAMLLHRADRGMESLGKTLRQMRPPF